MTLNYENYHNHSMESNISTPDSVLRREDIAIRSVELGQKTLWTTEHGYAGNFHNTYDIAEKYGLKFRFGIEFYFVKNRFEKDRTNSHLMIMAKNKYGMKQMNRIMSEAAKTGYYYKPRIDLELLLSLNPEDVIVTTTCIAGFINKYEDGRSHLLPIIRSHFKDNFFIELHTNNNDMQKNYNQILLDIHENENIPLMYATDTHYITEEQEMLRDKFLKSKGIYYEEESGFVMDYPDAETAMERFITQGVFTREQAESALRNTMKLADLEEIKLNKEIKMPSKYPEKSHEEKMAILTDTIKKEWKKDKIHVPEERRKEYVSEIKMELDVVEKTKTEDYFLLNYDLMERAKKKGAVLTNTGRGSAPSFFLNKLLRFTDIDRLDSAIPLYSSRFMSISRILDSKSLPDIDYNLYKREFVTEASKEILGEDNAYFMMAYGTMQRSEAFRAFCRAERVPADQYNDVGKDLDKYVNDPKWSRIIKESEGFIGVIDSISPHPCAVLLLTEPISEEVGVLRVGDELVACIDSYTSDVWKYLKNDELTVTVVEIIAEGFRAINQPILPVRELIEATKNDEKVWKLFEDGLTATLNQAETDNATPKIMRYKPRSIEDLSAFVAAIRPSFASLMDTFLDRKPFSYGVEAFDELMKPSGGFLLYQESIMQTLVFAGFPEDETYTILKQISKKKGDMSKIQDQFYKGFAERSGASTEEIDVVWQVIEDAVKYSFNASHSLSVALDCLYGAYLKANYPLEYYSVVLEIFSGKVDKTAKIIKELPYFGIKIKSPRFGISRSKYTSAKEENAIYKGLASIKFVNEKASEELYTLSQEVEDKDNLLDVFYRIKQQSIANARQMDILIKIGYFGSNDIGKKLALWEVVNKKLNKTLKEETRMKRLQEIRMECMDYEPVPFTTKDRIQTEIEHVGYTQYRDDKAPKSHYIVTATHTKYTPLIEFVRVKNGLKKKAKINKMNFYYEGNARLNVGDIVQINGVTQKEKSRLVDGKWIKTGEFEDVVTNFEVVNNQYD